MFPTFRHPCVASVDLSVVVLLLSGSAAEVSAGAVLLGAHPSGSAAGEALAVIGAAVWGLALAVLIGSDVLRAVHRRHGHETDSAVRAHVRLQR